jgi:hypothetical protein
MLPFVGPSTNKSFFTFVVLLVLIASIFTTQIAHAADSSAHPRLYFNQSDLDYLRELRTAPSHQTIWNNIESWADAHISDSPPAEPVGQAWGTWMGTAASIRRYIETMTFMYVMTEDVAYAETAKDWLLSIAEWSSWNHPANNWQVISCMAMAFAAGYDCLYDYLSLQERDKIRSIMVSRIGVLYEAYISDPNYPEDYPNHYAVLAGGLGLAGLAIREEYAEANEWVSLAIMQAEEAISYIGVDGGWIEGVMYSGYGMDALIPFADALRRVDGQDLFSGSVLAELPYYFIYMNYNNHSLQLEDNNWLEDYELTDLPFMYKLASEYNNGYAQQFAENYADQLMMQSFIWKSPTIAPDSPADLPLTRHFRGLGYVITRSGWGNNDLVFAFKSGTSRGHAHPSQNEFGIYYQGKPVTCGPGYVSLEPGDDTWTHNCLLVDGKGQGQEPGDYFSLPLGTTGVIEQVDVHDPYYRYVLGNASAVYNGQSGNGDLDEWRRHVVFVENPDYFVIYDDVAASESKQFDWLLQAPKVGSDTGNISVTGNTITLLRDGVKLVVNVLEPASFSHSIISYDNPYGASSYIELHPVENAANVHFLTVLFPLTENSSALNTERVDVGNLIGVKVIDGDNLDLILFSADGNPVNEYVELGASYQAADDNTYTFDGTKILAHFDDYQVMRLEKIFNIIPSLIIIGLILLAIIVISISIVLLRRR